MKLICFLLLLIATCYGQTTGSDGSAVGLTVTNAVKFPFCETASSNNTTNSTSNNSTSSSQSLCARKDFPLRCKFIEDPLNSRELIAVIEGNGVVFYELDKSTGTANPVALYPSKCKTLFVIGFLNTSILISSDNDDETHTDAEENPNCPALGLGAIDINTVIGSSSNASGSGSLTNVTVNPNTGLFQYMDNFVWSDTNKTLLVVGAFNVSSSGNTSESTNQTKTDYILALRNGNLASPDIIYQNSSFPFNFDWAHTVIFEKIQLATPSNNTNTTGTNTTTESSSSNKFYIVGPAFNTAPEENDLDDFFNRTANKVEVWNITEAAFPQLVSTLNLKEPRRLDVNPNATALYVSVLGNTTVTSSNTTTNNTNTTLPAADDSLQIYDISDLKSPQLSSSITYQAFLDAVRAAGGTPDSTVTSTGGKRITALRSPNDLLVGWNTGELGEWAIASNPLAPEFVGYVSTFSVATTDLGGNTTTTSTGNSTDLTALNAIFKGVTDICAWKRGAPFTTFITAYDNTKGGSLFQGFKRSNVTSV